MTKHKCLIFKNEMGITVSYSFELDTALSWHPSSATWDPYELTPLEILYVKKAEIALEGIS